MWHRLQVLVSKAQLAWLKAESYTTGKSIGQVIRQLIDDAISHRNKNYESGNSTAPEKQDTK